MLKFMRRFEKFKLLNDEAKKMFWRVLKNCSDRKSRVGWCRELTQEGRMFKINFNLFIKVILR